MKRNSSKALWSLAVVICMSLCWSCSDDILDLKPLNGYSEDNVYSDAALLRDYVNGIYRTSIRHSFDGENSLTDGLTDNAYNQHGSANGSIRVYTQAEVTDANGEGVTRNLWTSAFENIQKTNVFFEGTQESEIPSDQLIPLIAEVRFLRAYLYFELLRWYGEVPLFTESFDLDDESFAATRTSVDALGEFIVNECDQAMNGLLSMSDIDEGYESGMASIEAAMALKARTLLYLASPLFNESNDLTKWEAARDANEAVMNLGVVSLVDGAEQYGALFRGEVISEVIFARYFTSTINQGDGVNLWLFPNSYGGWATTTPTQDLVDGYELTNGLLPSDAGSGYDDQAPYVNRDPRFYQSILYNGAPFKDGIYDYSTDRAYPDSVELAGNESLISNMSNHNVSRTGYNFRKWVLEDQGEFSGNTGPWIVYRLGEFYLNYAEAELALGNETAARAAINEIRERVGMPAVTETGDALVERYRRERRIELLLEDHRFFDMRRWKIGDEVLGKPATGVSVYNNAGVMEYEYGRVVDGTRAWDDRQYLLPIPQTEIERSGGTLDQNDGY